MSGRKSPQARNGNDESDGFGIGAGRGSGGRGRVEFGAVPKRDASASAGASPAAPANVRSENGSAVGQAVVRWDAVADAAYYRIGWVNMETFRAVEAEGGREWLDVFAFHDVVNRSQTSQTLSDLEPGVQYAFIMASVGQRFGNVAGWSQWTYLTTTAAATTTCPTNAETPPGTPGGGSGAPTPTPAPGGRDYDTDDDGLIEITSLAQLDVIRHDLDGDGVSTHADHAAMFPNPAPGMGCLYRECVGYELNANLDFDTNGNGSADAGDAYWNDSYGWLPIGDPETAYRFNAVFDGNGHTIANLFIRWPDADYIGLFRATGADADIRNVRLTGVRVTGEDFVGGLAGNNDGSISGSSVTGRVSGAEKIGGLAGSNDGNVSGSHSSVPVTGSGERVGGLVGSNFGSISDSYATGAVTGEGIYVGGLVGVSGIESNDSISISNSYATGAVTGQGNYVGGLAGSSSGAITGSHATGNVTGEGQYVGGLVGSSGGAVTGSHATGDVTGEGGDVGGLAGYSGGAVTGSHATGNVTGESGSVGGLVGTEYRSSITASYATGSVTGSSPVGGLVGQMVGSNIAASYATGGVTGSGGSAGGLVGTMRAYYSSYSPYWSRITASYATGSVIGSSAGGLVGSADYYATVTTSYWDTQTTGRSDSAGGTGKTTRELQTPTGHTGIYAEWNADWWDFGTSRQYPALKYQGMDVGAQRR